MSALSRRNSRRHFLVTAGEASAFPGRLVAEFCAGPRTISIIEIPRGLHAKAVAASGAYAATAQRALRLANRAFLESRSAPR